MDAAAKPLNGRRVFFYFLAFFLAIMAVNAVFMTQALKTHTGVIADHTYKRGLDYDETLARAEDQKHLGLQESLKYESGKLIWIIKDKDGNPVSGAHVSATAIRAVQAGYDYKIDFKETDKGVYTASLNAPLPGAWVIKVNAIWDSQSYQTKLDVSAP